MNSIFMNIILLLEMKNVNSGSWKRSVSSRVARSDSDAPGHDGLNRMLDGFTDRTAYAVCTFAYSKGAGEAVRVFEVGVEESH